MDLGVQPLTPDLNLQNNLADKIFLNGQWIGMHSFPNELISDVRRMRQENQLPKEYSIVRDIEKKEIKIYTDAGRVQRAMFIVDQNELKIRKKHVKMIMSRDWDFEQFFRRGLIELLDVEEEESAMIAMFVSDIDKNR